MIFIFTGTQNISDLELLVKVKMHFGKNTPIPYFEFPEFVDRKHPQELFNFIFDIVKKQIDNNEDMLIVTWSDVVFSAVRYAVKESMASNVVCKCYQFDIDKSIVSDVLRSGLMTEWLPGCFDTCDKANLKLL